MYASAILPFALGAAALFALVAVGLGLGLFFGLGKAKGDYRGRLGDILGGTWQVHARDLDASLQPLTGAASPASLEAAKVTCRDSPGCVATREGDGGKYVLYGGVPGGAGGMPPPVSLADTYLYGKPFHVLADRIEGGVVRCSGDGCISSFP